MKRLLLSIEPKSAFGTPLLGDTMFGQLCWAISNRYGKQRLDKLLEGYTDNRPFAIVSDAFPKGYLPRPALPLHWLKKPDGENPKILKKRNWLLVRALSNPLVEMLPDCRSSKEIVASFTTTSKVSTSTTTFCFTHSQSHNSINRLTGTTGEDGFAPYIQTQLWFYPQISLDCYILLDTDRLPENELKICLEDIGAIGFGRDASIGLGKFEVKYLTISPLSDQKKADACLTLAACVPQGLGYEQQCCFYQTFTRFGRHGDLAAISGKNPFKNPILMARAGAVFGIMPPETGFIGQGLGDNRISKVIPETVHQGYSPIVAVLLSEPMAKSMEQVQ